MPERGLKTRVSKESPRACWETATWPPLDRHVTTSTPWQTTLRLTEQGVLVGAGLDATPVPQLATDRLSSGLFPLFFRFALPGLLPARGLTLFFSLAGPCPEMGSSLVSNVSQQPALLGHWRPRCYRREYLRPRSSRTRQRNTKVRRWLIRGVDVRSKLSSIDDISRSRQ
jgi:hypothetical protein